jgi:hypothetical protein
MDALSLLRNRSRQSIPTTDGIDASAANLRAIALPEKTPRDDLSRDIAFLLAEHPSLANQYREIDLDVMTESAKVQMLAEIKADLGIQPVKTRRLEYVGD